MVREIDQDGVALIRRFNRTVTERIGALEESFLGRDRPLGASRLLWEIGDDGVDLHEDGWRTRVSSSSRRTPPIGGGDGFAGQPQGSRRS